MRLSCGKGSHVYNSLIFGLPGRARRRECSLIAARAAIEATQKPWLDWKSIKSFPRDGESYLATTDHTLGGHPQVVYWDEGRLHVEDCDISYSLNFFSHWSEIPLPVADGDAA